VSLCLLFGEGRCLLYFELNDRAFLGNVTGRNLPELSFGHGDQVKGRNIAATQEAGGLLP
jgi:hypothetical protein